MKKLYSVNITSTALIYADNEFDAIDIARTKSGDIVHEDPFLQVNLNQEIKLEKNLPKGWDRLCTPYGRSRNVPIIKNILECLEHDTTGTRT